MALNRAGSNRSSTICNCVTLGKAASLSSWLLRGKMQQKNTSADTASGAQRGAVTSAPLRSPFTLPCAALCPRLALKASVGKVSPPSGTASKGQQPCGFWSVRLFPTPVATVCAKRNNGSCSDPPESGLLQERVANVRRLPRWPVV